MSLLDNLRNEVEIKESEHAAHMAEREAQQRYYDERLKQPMLQALTYFAEVVKNLKFLDMVTPVGLPIAPDGKSLVAMEQSGYEFIYDDAKNPLRMDIVCECLVSDYQRFFVSNLDKVERYTEFLDGMNLAYHRKTELDSKYDIRNAVFELEGPLKVGVTIKASPSDRAIYVYLRNLEAESEKKYQFSPEKLDADLLERLGRVLLRKEDTLVNIELPEEIRNELAMQVEAEKIERDTQLKVAFEEMRIEREAEAEAKMFSKRIAKLTSAIKAKIRVARSSG